MFDSLPTEPRDHILDRARCFFFDHGHDLASAAAMLGGAAAEARVVSCAIHLEETGRIDRRIRRDLVALHRLLALHDVGDPDDLETALFSTLHPASAEVETICLLEPPRVYRRVKHSKDEPYDKESTYPRLSGRAA